MITEIARRAIASKVRSAFNDTASGDKPVQRRPGGLFGPRSVAWRVHGDVTTMMVGGIAALLLQMLHPAVLAGVWDHSNVRRDMHGRLRRTARFIALTTYGHRSEALGAIERVRRIHENVRGLLPDGTAYSAADPELLTWVHLTETLSFLDAWIRYAEPAMSREDQDRYFAEVAVVAEALGAGIVPRTRADTMKAIRTMRPRLRADARTREMAAFVLDRSATRTFESAPLDLMQRAAVDLLPGWARRQHGLSSSGFARPMVAGGTLVLARTLRWALR
ncbi:oxygenase MpaB family protein [Novosphingobium sp. JCM 18896]|uniref:oxygenase MpaB family protein n=1 Tax=Novosphingobium sp. JCM 18896 TaxID=2989731 RepID=UPI002223931C|nr:oxygenase MpaB family protein [Novosphingobium sp. JCM 18896]MCW1430263.1 oxygenase MpaB family protein [Novosphingobium sp. JCM 18896]